MAVKDNVVNYTNGVGHVFAYVVGSTPYASNWLSYSQGGAALTPDSNVLYYILSDTVNSQYYKNRVYKWNGSAYESYIASYDQGMPANNAGYHNSIYRGKNLGTSYTAKQKSAIFSGTFEDLYIGDYWEATNTITTSTGITNIGPSPIKYRIAGFDYWYNTGDTACTTHHAVIVPDKWLYAAKMNDTEITTGAYVGSKMYTTYLTPAKTAINNFFGSSYILNHRALLAYQTTAYSSNTIEIETKCNWYNSTAELMNEIMMSGHIIQQNYAHSSNWCYFHTESNSQLPLFQHRPDLICDQVANWLRNVCTKGYFCSTGDTGFFSNKAANQANGVRPVFGIKG